MKGAEHSNSSNDSHSSHMAARDEEEGVRVGKGLSSACPFVEERKNGEGRSAAPSLAAGGASAKMQDQHRCALAVSAVEFEPGEREKKWAGCNQYNTHTSHTSLVGCLVVGSYLGATNVQCCVPWLTMVSFSIWLLYVWPSETRQGRVEHVVKLNKSQ